VSANQEILFCSTTEGERIAYSVVGSGSPLLCPSGWVTHLEQTWENRSFRTFFERLARHHAVIRFDRLGCGLSDRTSAESPEAGLRTLEALAAHLGLQRFDIFDSAGGFNSIAYAVRHPQRVDHLILHGAFAHGDALASPEFKKAMLDLVSSHWGFGSEALADIFVPGASAEDRRWYAAFERAAAPAETAHRLLAAVYQVDVRPLLPLLRVPTLVIHRQGDRAVSFLQGRELAAAIPDARLLALEGRIHLPYLGDSGPILSAITNFLGDPPGGAPEEELELEPHAQLLTADPHTARPILVTVLFTDICGSTEIAEEIGDRAWRELLDEHQALLRRNLTLYGGREVDLIGDGCMAVFESPSQAVRCASAITSEMVPLNLEIRAGLHAGECQLVGDKVRGIAVHIGARVAAVATRGEVMVSSTVRDLVAGSGLRFRDRGPHLLKGVRGEWRLYTVEPLEEPPATDAKPLPVRRTEILPSFRLY
jgi:class 3 adenylate cyclase/pimeloyl-ACP methyl ester carboxylesterase